MRPPAQKSSRKSLVVACIVGALVLGAGVSAVALWRGRHDGNALRKDGGSARQVVIVISGDTAGWITPCGCTSNQSGGLPRRASYLDEARRSAEVVYADAGGAPAGDSEYQRLKFESILRGETAMGLSAHNIGAAEAALGASYLRGLSEKNAAPFVSANLSDAEGKAVAPALRIITAGGKRIALAGVLSPRYATGQMRIAPPHDAILAALPAFRGQYDALVVLAYLPEEELNQLAAALPEADAIVGGPTGQTMPPRRVGPTLLTSATNKGKFLARLEVPAQSSEPWTATIAELTPTWHDHPAQWENVAQYLSLLAKRDFKASETGLAPAAVAGQPANFAVAGSQACSVCHDVDHKLWKATAHARAWQDLEARKSQADPSCQVCHTTGYGMPGGFVSVAASRELLSAVGCEDCHGPASAHSWQPSIHTPYAAKDQCVRCHDHENSPAFEYKTYWEKIVHGKEKAAPRGPVVKREVGSEISNLRSWNFRSEISELGFLMSGNPHPGPRRGDKKE